MSSQIINLEQKLEDFKKKFYANLLVKGMLLSLGILFCSYLIVNSVEFFGRFSSEIRLTLLLIFITASLISFFKFVLNPLISFLGIKSLLSDEDAAKKVGDYYPSVKDKLLNTLQLNKSFANNNSELLLASISQRNTELSTYNFAEIVDYSENKKYLRLLLIPLFITLCIFITIPKFFTDSTKRIVLFNKTFEDDLPFQFDLLNKDLKAIKGEDFEVKLKVGGDFIPSTIYLVTDGRKNKLTKDNKGNYSYTLKNIQKESGFTFEANGFESKEYTLELVNRPSLTNMKVHLKYPSYIRKANEQLSNIGNMVIPEGTQVQWIFETVGTENFNLAFGNKKQNATAEGENTYTFSKRFTESESYSIELRNKNSQNKEAIAFNVAVIKDQFPALQFQDFKDSTLFNYISLAGSISDDYGINKLEIHYSINSKKSNKNIIKVPISQGLREQKFYVQWLIDTLNLQPGNKLSYYLEVWDNDGVNGSKSTKSAINELEVPSTKQLEEQLAKASKTNEKSLESMASKSAKVQKELEALENKLKSKSSLSWQDKKNIENILNEHQKTENQVNDLKKNFKSMEDQEEMLNELSPELKEKVEELKKLMDNLLDEETKKMYEQLEKLMEENTNKDEVQRLLDKLQQKEESMENELKKALEMFKQMQFEQKLEKAIDKLDNLAKEQEKLAEKSEDKNNNAEELKKEQEELNKKFEDVKQEMKDLKDINKELENKRDIENTEEKQSDIGNEQKKSLEQLDNKQNKKAGDSQKKAAKKMQQLSEQMKQMQSAMQMKQMQENLEDLRAILENLMHLSFDQEDLMKEFKKVNQSDPKFVTLSQKQLKLKDDSKIIEDSLMALSRRVTQIQSFVTREVVQMNNYMDESSAALKERRLDLATGKQQFAMTSINNLALLLDDVLKQMQDQMSQAMSSGSKSCPNPGNKPGNQLGMGDLQKQLNQRIQQLQKGNKGGKELSEELAKIAAQQEMIRRALKSMEKKGKNGEKGGSEAGGNYKELQKQMEETESDLVNKRLSQELLKRQSDILTRLLEAEKSARERDLDEKREAEQAKKSTTNSVPPSFENYFKAKQKEIDLLKTISPQFNSFYRQESNSYFQKLEQQ